MMRGYATSFCLLSLLGACTLAMDESPTSTGSATSNTNSAVAASSPMGLSSSHAPRGLVYNIPIGSSSSSNRGNAASFLQIPSKRAFTYRTEFKRLPLYQFGLGKRARSYAFGLGKRGKQYAFGLGKRSSSGFEQQQQLRPEQIQAALNYLSSNEDSSLGQSDYWLEKRSAGAYNFGLGKRTPGSSNFYDLEDQRLLLPVKQLRNNKYVFGLGKRRLYDLDNSSSSSSSSDSDDVDDVEFDFSDDEAAAAANLQ